MFRVRYTYIVKLSLFNFRWLIQSRSLVGKCMENACSWGGKWGESAGEGEVGEVRGRAREGCDALGRCAGEGEVPRAGVPRAGVLRPGGADPVEPVEPVEPVRWSREKDALWAFFCAQNFLAFLILIYHQW